MKPNMSNFIQAPTGEIINLDYMVGAVLDGRKLRILLADERGDIVLVYKTKALARESIDSIFATLGRIIRDGYK